MSDGEGRLRRTSGSRGNLWRPGIQIVKIISFSFISFISGHFHILLFRLFGLAIDRDIFQRSHSVLTYSVVRYPHVWLDPVIMP
jgi:hypothetical protein